MHVHALSTFSSFLLSCNPESTWYLENNAGQRGISWNLTFFFFLPCCMAREFLDHPAGIKPEGLICLIPPPQDTREVPSWNLKDGELPL